MRLFLVDVNGFTVWVDHPEKKINMDCLWAVPNFMWELDSHPGMWMNGRHVVRWWTESPKNLPEPMLRRVRKRLL